MKNNSRQNLQRLLIFQSILLFVGCASNPRVVQKNYDLKDVYIAENVNLAGKNVYVAPFVDSLKAWQEPVQESLTKNGFVLVNQRKDAHLWITVEDVLEKNVSDQLGDGAQTDQASNFTTSTTATSLKDGKLVRSTIITDKQNPKRKITFSGYSQRYGKRPQTLIWRSVTISSKDSLKSDVMVEFMKDILEKTDGLSSKVIEETQKGPPGCAPRFGYEVLSKDPDGESNSVISEVHKGSPADKIGLKVGDMIEAIDSIKLHEKSFPTQINAIYENMTTVPIKVKRGSEMLRLTIKPALMCI